MRWLLLNLHWLLVALLLGHGAAAADSSLAITVGRIDVEDRLKPGGRYELPSVGVINTGDERQTFEIKLGYLDGQKERRPPAGWISFGPQQFTLDAGEAQTVDLHLTLPAGAEPGDYFAFIEAQIEGGREQSVQASVATKLTFSVSPANWLDAQVTRINRWLDDMSPWVYLVAGAALVALAVRLSQRWFRFRLPFEIR